MIMGGALLTKCLRVSQEEQDSPINDGGRPNWDQNLYEIALDSQSCIDVQRLSQVFEWRFLSLTNYSWKMKSESKFEYIFS